MGKPVRQGILALDVGTSSVRAVVYDGAGRMLPDTLFHFRYKLQTGEAGEASSRADPLVRLVGRSIDATLAAAHRRRVRIIAVAASCYWHSLLGIDRAGRPTTEVLTWADNRGAAESRRLRTRYDERAYHARTGCFFHATYWPAKLRWLRSARPAAFKRTVRWVSLGEYLYYQLLGEYRVSLSIASGTGLLDVHRCVWDQSALRLAGLRAQQLSPLDESGSPLTALRPSYRRRWPALNEIPWFLPLGDGALANVGAGCVSPRWFCATVGTSAALRVILDQEGLRVPWSTFVYRLDRRRFVLGGALSAGGNVVRWVTDELGAKRKQRVQREAAALAPDSHGLTILPFWAGERSPSWRADARAVIAGLSLGSRPHHLVRAAMESISYQFVTVAAAMQRVMPRPEMVIGTGGQLVHSPEWSQMLADALNLRVSISAETEASSRGAALLALHALGKLPRLWSTTPAGRRPYQPRRPVHVSYEQARRRQERLYALLFRPRGQPEAALPSAAVGSGSKTTDLRSRAAKR